MILSCVRVHISPYCYRAYPNPTCVSKHYIRDVFVLFQGIRDIHEDSLTIFKILDPRPDVILIGYGDRALFTDNVTKEEREIRKENTKNLAKLTIAMRIQVNAKYS